MPKVLQLHMEFAVARSNPVFRQVNVACNGVVVKENSIIGVVNYKIVDNSRAQRLPKVLVFVTFNNPNNRDRNLNPPSFRSHLLLV